MSDELTIGEFVGGILPRLIRGDNKFPKWPPDCFAICLALMKRTGAYSQLFLDWPPGKESAGALDKWINEVRDLGAQWRAHVRGRDLQFSGLETEWRAICDSFGRPLATLNDDRPLLEALIKVVAVADEASEGVGAPNDPRTYVDDGFLDIASDLPDRGTLCFEIDKSRLRVLPRMHTPQNGLTERSLSLNLSLCDPSEVVPQWLTTPFTELDSLNILMIPWPIEVFVSQFRDATYLVRERFPEGFGFFNYDTPGADSELVEFVASLVQETKRNTGRVDGVLLPELAITETKFHDIRASLPAECFLIAGVGSKGASEVRMSFPPLAEVIQKKHHPWKLNDAQVIQYGLGGILSPSREWWEYGDFTDRRLSFVSMSDDLVVAALVCEDLARPDPVANLVRTVGPNLLFALLMDGPQLRERWAARYATVLADDPGCSVLALTSIGMSQLSRPQSGPNRSRVIALWKDALHSSATEIELPPGYDAVAVSLSLRYKEEYTADGRGDDGAAAYPILAGVHPIRDPRTGRPR
jgi:hypothetical protein